MKFFPSSKTVSDSLKVVHWYVICLLGSLAQTFLLLPPGKLNWRVGLRVLITIMLWNEPWSLNFYLFVLFIKLRFFWENHNPCSEGIGDFCNSLYLMKFWSQHLWPCNEIRFSGGRDYTKNMFGTPKAFMAVFKMLDSLTDFLDLCRCICWMLFGRQCGGHSFFNQWTVLWQFEYYCHWYFDGRSPTT